MYLVKYMHSIIHVFYMNAEVIGDVYTGMYKCISMCAGYGTHSHDMDIHTQCYMCGSHR